MTFQHFDPPAEGSDPGAIAERVHELRARFLALGVDGIVVPLEDEYQSEYVPPWDDRLRFVTGFTGSAGRALILRERALFVTDGRYTLQAAVQVDGGVFDIVSKDEDAEAWMAAHLPGARLGVDPMLHPPSSLKRYRDAGAELIDLKENPVDLIWTSRPAVNRGKVRPHPQALAGLTHAQKREELCAALKTDALFIAASDTVSWLMNWRGADIAHTPLVLSRALVTKDGTVTVFCPRDILGPLADGVDVVAPEDMLHTLAHRVAGARVTADPAATPEAILAVFREHGTLVEGPDPAKRMKAIKNAAEIAGMRASHHRDGIAMVRFLHWLDNNAVGTSEIEIAQVLEALRREAGAIDISFATIAGSGPHGAIVHYRVDRSTNRTVEAGDPILIDSGGQYPDGTTDITRTIVAGAPTDAFRTQFTRVLSGHIAVAMQRFPQRTSGAELDGLARAALWQAGFNYLHGTGHGVGAALSVHEGPPGISKRSVAPLEAGMILSNEPGYYREGHYGIRIENLCLVTQARVPPGGEIATHSLEALTLAPIDTRLIEPNFLSAAQIGWLDSYHARVYGALSGDLAAAERAWLAARCRPIADR